jgi:hypothetical protein
MFTAGGGLFAREITNCYFRSLHQFHPSPTLCAMMNASSRVTRRALSWTSICCFRYPFVVSIPLSLYSFFQEEMSLSPLFLPLVLRAPGPHEPRWDSKSLCLPNLSETPQTPHQHPFHDLLSSSRTSQPSRLHYPPPLSCETSVSNTYENSVRTSTLQLRRSIIRVAIYRRERRTPSRGTRLSCHVDPTLGFRVAQS